ncbi:MAG: hypothetical protein ACE5F1_15390 [Planctomycetota bacterium]
MGYKDVLFPNTTARGTRVLDARVVYPSTKLGPDTPIIKKAGGYPVFVFMPGWNLFGKTYVEIGYQMAISGYVAVMLNSGRGNAFLQVDDCIALFTALEKETAKSSVFFSDAFDMKHSAVGGHSSGAGNVARVLAENPGYLAGVSLAPWIGHGGSHTKDHAPKVRVPLILMNGLGDTLTNWKTHALELFNQATGFTGIKMLYLMNKESTHMNVAAWTFPTSTPRDKELFDLTFSVVIGFLDYYVKGDPRSLDFAVGRTARAQKRLVQLYIETETPTLFKSGPEEIGKTMSFHVLSEPGVGIFQYALKRASIRTPIGLLLLDPATLGTGSLGPVNQGRLLSFDLPVPALSYLRGLVLPFQALAPTRSSPFRYTGSVDLRVAR